MSRKRVFVRRTDEDFWVDRIETLTVINVRLLPVPFFRGDSIEYSFMSGPDVPLMSDFWKDQIRKTTRISV